MHFLIVSKGGDGLALGLRLLKEGHQCAISIEKSDCQRAGEGLIEHVDDPMAYARNEDVDCALWDMVGMGGMADALRDLGIPILGAGRALDLLELDRIAGLRTFQALGLQIPETEFFEDADFDRAIEFVRKDGGKFVFKPCGNISTDKTFIGEDVEELIDFIEHQREESRSGEVKHPAFALQRFVEGIEVSIERWYSHGTPIVALDNMTFEEKKFLAGGLGPAIGCAGNVVMDAAPRLVQETVAKLDRFADAHAVTGPIDLNTITNVHGPFILEATARFGYDAIWSFFHRWHMPIGETLLQIAEGEEPEIDLDPRMGAAVRVSVPPYPAGDPAKARGTPVVDDILDQENLWPGDVMEVEGKLQVAGVDGVVYIVTGLGRTPKDAYQECYDWLDDARLPDRQYRCDLADRVSEELPKLVHLGYDLAQSRRLMRV